MVDDVHVDMDNGLSFVFEKHDLSPQYGTHTKMVVYCDSYPVMTDPDFLSVVADLAAKPNASLDDIEDVLKAHGFEDVTKTEQD